MLTFIRISALLFEILFDWNVQKQLQKIREGSRAKKYSNKGSRDGNKI